ISSKHFSHIKRWICLLESSESSTFSELSGLVAWLEVSLATPVVLDDLYFYLIIVRS
ncbi:10504_t:CDS:1, partial [Rhizophagus irregularis]